MAECSPCYLTLHKLQPPIKHLINLFQSEIVISGVVIPGQRGISCKIYTLQRFTIGFILFKNINVFALISLFNHSNLTLSQDKNMLLKRSLYLTQLCVYDIMYTSLGRSMSVLNWRTQTSNSRQVISVQSILAGSGYQQQRVYMNNCHPGSSSSISPSLEYVRAASVNDAILLLNDETRPNSRLLAGGTDLLVLARRAQVNWDRLIDISHLEELKKVEEYPNHITIGAGVTHSAAAEHPLIRTFAPLLAEACSVIGSKQIRNRGTIGGNVANAAVCADTVPPLVCHDAIVHIVSKENDTSLPMAEIIKAPGNASLLPGSIIREFQIPKLPQSAKSAYLRIGRRQAVSKARVSLSCIGWLNEEGFVHELRLVPGSCTARSQRFDQAEAVLIEKRVSEDLALEAGKAAARQLISIVGNRASLDYKKQVLSKLVECSIRSVFNLPEGSNYENYLSSQY